METKVYVLIEPHTLKVRYIGITSQSLEKRLCGHITDSLLCRDNSRKRSWVVSLKRKGFIPIIRQIAVLPTRKEALELESSLINKYITKHNLVNDPSEGKFTSRGKKSAMNLKNKIVYTYSYQGEFIKEYHSIKECSEQTTVYESTIDKCLAGQYKHAKQLQFSRTKVDKMPDLTNYSKGNWKDLEILDTTTNEILFYPSRQKAAEALKFELIDTTWKGFLGPLNRYYGNRYKVKVDGEWKQSTYYNTGVKVVLENETLLFENKKSLGKYVGLKGGFSQAQLDKFISKKFTNIKEILFSMPLIEVTQ